MMVAAGAFNQFRCILRLDSKRRSQVAPANNLVVIIQAAAFVQLPPVMTDLSTVSVHDHISNLLLLTHRL